ncbi:MAG TPA: hypothetical protein VH834_04940 [Solirubrobacteraceae bacterium]|jgi:hypothetical protein
MPYTPWQRTMSSDPNAEPVVENPRRPEMTDEPPKPRRIKGQTVLMADKPPASKGSRNRMEPVPAKLPRASRQKTPLPDQEERATRGRPRAARGEGYVRLHMRVEPDGLSIQNITAVDGPLIAHEDLHGDLAYEVTVGGDRVASGSLPDVGMRRSFPPLDPAPGQEGHFFTPAPSYEFIARVPKDAISLAALPKVEVGLYGIKEGPVPRTEGPEPLGAVHGRQLREVARLRGISLDDLPSSVQAEARRALR